MGFSQIIPPNDQVERQSKYMLKQLS
jgi:hypothetical protein